MHGAEELLIFDAKIKRLTTVYMLAGKNLELNAFGCNGSVSGKTEAFWECLYAFNVNVSLASQ